MPIFLDWISWKGWKFLLALVGLRATGNGSGAKSIAAMFIRSLQPKFARRQDVSQTYFMKGRCSEIYN